MTSIVYYDINTQLLQRRLNAGQPARRTAVVRVWEKLRSQKTMRLYNQQFWNVILIFNALVCK